MFDLNGTFHAIAPQQTFNTLPLDKPGSSRKSGI
jgi:hypothetical protein